MLALFTCSKEYILVKLRAQSGSIAYNPGDHIAVYPENPSSDVDLICMRAELPEGINGDKTICLSSLQGNLFVLHKIQIVIMLTIKV